MDLTDIAERLKNLPDDARQQCFPEIEAGEINERIIMDKLRQVGWGHLMGGRMSFTGDHG